MAENELIALYWTVAGPTDVHVGREWSLFEWRERCAQAARVGFAGLGLWHADIEHQLETRTLKEIKQIFDDAGLRYLQVEFLDNFWFPRGDAARAASDERRRLLFDTAAAFDAHHIKVGNIHGNPAEIDQLIEGFGELCRDAANHTNAKVVYEITPFDTQANNLDAALRLVEGAGAENGGLAVDTWHMSKLGITPEQVGNIPSRYLTWVEISDGQLENMPDPVEETVNHRRLPGEGDFDIPGYLEACQAAGYRGPWGVEVLSAALRDLPIEQAFDRAYETTAAQFRAGVA
ncbi:MAG: sugar phosphate isomerase/epimerase [Solirubrobacterales bacterium]|nr:sugar phosphate isomerase/epimerase [Solirubrobacterales bacterium]MBV9714622.1 sugar phosphate isomerase/epimerase [Solirubrobacterales bacterium]